MRQALPTPIRSPGAMRAAAPALAAALLFGASTPVAKLLVGEVAPLLLAGLLYLGSGIGLAAVLLFGRIAARARGRLPSPGIPAADWPWLAAAVFFGGLLGPALLMSGLARTDAASASLLLNVEGVLTAVLAWWVFGENADRRIVLGMLAIVAGGALLAWEPGGASFAPAPTSRWRRSSAWRCRWRSGRVCRSRSSGWPRR